MRKALVLVHRLVGRLDIAEQLFGEFVEWAWDLEDRDLGRFQLALQAPSDPVD